MSRMMITIGLLLLLAGWPGALTAQTDSIKYFPDYEDPVLKEIGDRVDSLKAIRDSVTEDIRNAQQEYQDKMGDEKKVIRLDFANIVKPESPDQFTTVYHFPPVAQYRTGTCWCFSGTSFLESEVYRLTDRKIKLSEMYTVYHEYLEKARQFVRERGQENVWQGSEANAVVRMMKLYGAVPYDIYPGVGPDGRYDHNPMAHEIRAFLNYVKVNDYWDEEKVLSHVRVILDSYLGSPPETFEFEGQELTPRQFVSSVLKLSLDDYVATISTLSQPFYTFGPLEVFDNWWYDSSYYNIPLDEWYGVIKNAIDHGYSVAIGGDVSEPGKNGFEDAAVIPDYDIPQDYINQNSREFRLYNETTTDDHVIHLVGYTTVDGRDWFLIKDSSRSGRWGKFEGYYFFRDDYIRLKMMDFLVHKDAMKEVLAKQKEVSKVE